MKGRGKRKGKVALKGQGIIGDERIDSSMDCRQEQHIAENGESADRIEYQGTLHEDSPRDLRNWTEDNWHADWWYDDSHDWSSDWLWCTDSSWHAPDWTTEDHQAVLPLPSQSILPQASSAAKAAPIARHAPPQTVSTVIAVSPVLAGTGQVVNEGFIDSSISSNSRSSGKKHSTLIVSKMVVGALLLTGAWLSDVAFNPWYTPLSAPVFSEAPLLSLSSPFRDEKIDTSGHIDRPIDQDRMVTLIVRQGSLQHVFNGFKWLSGSMLSSGSICEKAWCA